MALDTEDMITTAFFPSEMKEKIRNLHFEEDQKRSIGVRRLLLKAMQDKGFKHFSFSEIQYQSSGKPFVNSGLYFNMSHNGRFLACGVGEVELGLDVEEMKEIDWEIFRSYFSSTEWDLIQKAERPLAQFYQYWTVKEAILKLIGTGLPDDLDAFHISLPNVQYRKQDFQVQTTEINGFCLAVATHKPEAIRYIHT